LKRQHGFGGQLDITPAWPAISQGSDVFRIEREALQISEAGRIAEAAEDEAARQTPEPARVKRKPDEFLRGGVNEHGAEDDDLCGCFRGKDSGDRFAMSNHGDLFIAQPYLLAEEDSGLFSNARSLRVSSPGAGKGHGKDEFRSSSRERVELHQAAGYDIDTGANFIDLLFICG
jgi:hypothetical protein